MTGSPACSRNRSARSCRASARLRLNLAERAPSYLEPYSRARRRKAKGARALLWVGRRDQIVRFEAIVRACPLAGRRVLDVGCGPADLLGFLRRRRILPAHYVGLEAQPWLVRAARRRDYVRSTIVEGDFVKDPETLRVGAEVVIFSGSLNLLSSRQFYRSLGDAWDATRDWLVFNFLCTPDLAGARWLHWHRRGAVLAFARRLGARVHMDDRYEPGDCLAVWRKPRSERGGPVTPP